MKRGSARKRLVNKFLWLFGRGYPLEHPFVQAEVVGHRLIGEDCVSKACKVWEKKYGRTREQAKGVQGGVELAGSAKT